VEWKIEQRVPDHHGVAAHPAKHPRLLGIGAQNQFWLLPAERGQS
jgi:hypothetical protein